MTTETTKTNETKTSLTQDMDRSTRAIIAISSLRKLALPIGSRRARQRLAEALRILADRLEHEGPAND